jgi:hypothetical protein
MHSRNERDNSPWRYVGPDGGILLSKPGTFRLVSLLRLNTFVYCRANHRSRCLRAFYVSFYEKMRPHRSTTTSSKSAIPVCFLRSQFCRTLPSAQRICGDIAFSICISNWRNKNERSALIYDIALPGIRIYHRSGRSMTNRSILINTFDFFRWLARNEG